MNVNHLPKNIIIRILNYLDINNLGRLMLVSKNFCKISKTLFLNKLIMTRNTYLKKFYSEILLFYINDKYNFNNLDTIDINFNPILFYEIRSKNIIGEFIVDVIFKKYAFIKPNFLAFLMYEWNSSLEYRIKEYVIRYRTIEVEYNIELLDEIYNISKSYFGENFNKSIKITN